MKKQLAHCCYQDCLEIVKRAYSMLKQKPLILAISISARHFIWHLTKRERAYSYNECIDKMLAQRSIQQTILEVLH